MLKIDSGIEEQINMAQPAGMKAPKKPSKGSIIESIDTTTNEMAVIATLKEAIANWLKLDDFADYYEEGHTLPGFCLLLGQLEMSLIRRKQSLDEDQKAFSELKDE